MLGAWRDANARRTVPIVRYGNPDASPQGREIYVCKIWEVESGQYSNSEKIIAPAQTLAHSHAGTMDRAMCSLHTAFLMTGPTDDGMRYFGASFAGIVADLADISNRDIPDLTEVYLKGHTPERLSEVAGTFFYSNALSVYDPSHLQDWVLYQTLVRRHLSKPWVFGPGRSWETEHSCFV